MKKANAAVQRGHAGRADVGREVCVSDAAVVGAAQRAPGHLTQPMLLSQLQNVQRMIGGADQKIGKDAIDRFSDLTDGPPRAARRSFRMASR